MELTFLKGALESVKSAAAPVIFQARKHAPEMLVGFGAASIAAGTVLSCRATLKAKDILSEEIETDAVYEEDGETVIVPKDEDQMRREQLAKGGKVVLSYLPGVGLVVAGTAMMVCAKSIEHRRFVAALGAYSSLEAMFEAYRGRVISELGPDADTRALTGSTVEKAEVFEQQDDGSLKKHKVDLQFRDSEDPFHRIFDDCNCPGVWVPNLNENMFQLECWEKRFNQKLKAEGRVFLQDVYQALGFEYLPIGQFVGWVADDVEGSKDGFISFGIDYAYLKSEIAAAMDENRVPEPSIWLEFNCDGEVWNNPLKKKHDR